MKPPRLPLLLALVLGLLAPWSPAPATAAAYGVITGRVVDKDGLPMADVHLNLFRPGSTIAAEWTRTAADGTFEFRPSTFDDPVAASYLLLVGSGSDATTAIPTWYDGSGADGGVRGAVVGLDPASDQLVAAPAAAGAATIPLSASPTGLGDIRPQEGALVTWDSRDTLGNKVDRLAVTAPWAARGTVSTGRTYGGWPTLLESGHHTITLEASAVDPGGQQQVTLDLTAGSRPTVPVTWAARYFLFDDDLTWGGDWRSPLPGERPAVGTRLRAVAEFANSGAVISGPPISTGVTFQWYRGAKPIAGATRATYKLVAADRGRKIGFRMNAAARAGYPAASYRGPQVKVAAVKASVRARFVGRTVRVKVGLSNGSRPRGRVALLLTDESRFPAPLVSKKLKVSARGVVTLRIPEPFVRTQGDTAIWFAVRFVPTRKKVSVGIDVGPNADRRGETLSE